MNKCTHTHTHTHTSVYEYGDNVYVAMYRLKPIYLYIYPFGSFFVSYLPPMPVTSVQGIAFVDFKGKKSLPHSRIMRTIILLH